MQQLCSPSIPCLQAVVCVRVKLRMSLPSAGCPWTADLRTAARKRKRYDCGYGSREAAAASWRSCSSCAVRLYRVCKRWCVCESSKLRLSLPSAGCPWTADLRTAARKRKRYDCGYGSREAAAASWRCLQQLCSPSIPCLQAVVAGRAGCHIAGLISICCSFYLSPMIW